MNLSLIWLFLLPTDRFSNVINDVVVVVVVVDGDGDDDDDDDDDNDDDDAVDGDENTTWLHRFTLLIELIEKAILKTIEIRKVSIIIKIQYNYPFTLFVGNTLLIWIE